MVHRYHCPSNIWMLVCEGYIVIIIILGKITPNLLHNIVLATLFACFRAAVCFRATCVSFLAGSGRGEGAPDPAFPPLFRETPASRTFFISFPNTAFLSQKNTLKRLISTNANKCKM